MQSEMQQLRAENEYLRAQNSTNPPPPVDLMGSVCSSQDDSKQRETFGVKRTRKTMGQVAPVKKIQLNTRKTIAVGKATPGS